MNEELKYIYETTNSWLKYAETKNAGLVAFNAAVLVGILQINNGNKFLIYLSIIIFTLSIILNILSILAVLKKPLNIFLKTQTVNLEKDKDSISIYYFSDLAKLNSNQLLDIISYKFKNEDNVNKASKDLANQIIINAKIAFQKFKIFNLSGFLIIMGLICTALSILIGNCA